MAILREGRCPVCDSWVSTDYPMTDKDSLICPNCYINISKFRLGNSPQKSGASKMKIERDVPHYSVGGLETIEIMKAKFTPEEFRGYLKGNVVKYIFRYRHKDGLRDLQKATTYLNWLIDEEQS
jgi:hypothetical protein